ncbi:MAG: recombination-associated protein RdgC [Gammaproteobacteria bacterium]|nr:recombination-associated protein RdgC [Gammaproteobacteria bacterium]
MFRNLRFYRLDGDWPESEEAVSQQLQKSAFRACGPLTERSSGWVAIDSENAEALARRVNGADLMRLRSQSRVLPPSAINEELEVRIEEYRERMQEKPSPREKRRLKAETRVELLPKAMLKSDRIWGYVDLKEKVLDIDAGQNAAAERFLLRLRSPFEQVLINPLLFNEPVSGLLTKIFFGNAPGQFAVGRECRMQDAADAGSIVRWTDFDLSDKTIRDHVANGMHLTHLAIVYDNVMSFVLDENGVISKMRFLGMDDEGDDDGEPMTRLDAEFVLATGTLRLLLGDLKKLLGGIAGQ